MDYIHFNPARHGLAPHPAGWPFSTVARCVTLGLYPISWAFTGTEPADAGERL